MYDTLIVGGTIVDGSGDDGFRGDLAVKDGQIVAVGDLVDQPTVRLIDAAGLVVSPGFIDSHCHSELSLLADPTAQSKLRQGVTTEILGNCGWSAFPLGGAGDDALRDLSAPIFGHPTLSWDWEDLTGYFARLDTRGSAVNVATLVGHGNVRAAVLGLENRPPQPRELRAMKALVQVAMDQGALGLSTGLAYPPGVYASTEEIVELARVSSKAGGLYATHMRDQVDHLLDSIQESLDVGRRANTRVVISHHKSVGRRNYGKVQDSLSLMDAAVDDGVAASSDIYPYLAGSSSMLMLLPPWSWADGLEAVLSRLADPAVRVRIARDLETGLPGWENRVGAVGWENIVVAHVGSEINQHLQELTVSEAAARAGKLALDFVCDLLLDERCDVGDLTVNSCEDDLRAVLTHPLTVVGSDGLDVGERPHPRQYGTFPRVLGRYVRDEGVLTLAAAIHKMTAQPADIFGLSGVGRLRKGYSADIAIFDPITVRDTATYRAPRQYPEGVVHVMVGGVLSVSAGEFTGDLNGARIRRRGSK